MSMNLHVSGTRDITVNKTGTQELQHISFDLYQTPTNITRELLSSTDIAQAYRDWVNSTRHEYQEPVYDKDDFFGEGEIIGYKTICYEDDHLKDFDEFIKQCEEDGYELEFYEL